MRDTPTCTGAMRKSRRAEKPVGTQRAKQAKSRASLARCIVLYMPHTPCKPSFELVELYIHILYLPGFSSAQNKAFVSTGG